MSGVSRTNEMGKRHLNSTNHHQQISKRAQARVGTNWFDTDPEMRMQIVECERINRTHGRQYGIGPLHNYIGKPSARRCAPMTGRGLFEKNGLKMHRSRRRAHDNSTGRSSPPRHDIVRERQCTPERGRLVAHGLIAPLPTHHRR